MARTPTSRRDSSPSHLVNGGAATGRWLVALDGQEARTPRASADHPDPAFLAWHRREVFRAG